MTIGRKGSERSEDDDVIRLDGGAATQQLRQAESGAVISRRGVLWRAGIASAVGAVALSGLDEQRAQAATGGSFILGAANDAALATTLKATTNAPVGLSQLMALDGSTNITVSTLDVTGPPGGTAINGHNTSGIGTSGSSTSSTGVVGSSGTGSGVAGTSVSGTGVVGSSSSGDGISGASFANGQHGVIGSDTSPTGGTGVSGVSTHGVALSATSGSGGGVQADAATFHLRLTNSVTRNAPTGDAVAHQLGDLVETTGGDLWLCTTAGTPGTWRKVSGPTTAGAFHVLPTPKRIYDSRPGTLPSIGPKTPLSGNIARTLDVTANGSGVPADATAVSVTVLLVNAANVNGNLTIWADAVARPSGNTMVWGGSAGRFTALAISALTAGRLQVSASGQTDVVLDIVGYYR